MTRGVRAVVAAATFMATALPMLASACSSFDGTAPPNAPADAADVTTEDVLDAPVDTAPTPPPPSAPKRMFVTAGEFTGDLVSVARSAAKYDGGDGLAAADALCAREASALGGGPWKAWISTSGNAGVSAIARFAHPNEPRFDTSGRRLFDSLGGKLKVIIPGIDGKPTVARRAWTDTTEAGYSVGDFQEVRADCMGWTTGASTSHGASGDPGVLDKWSVSYFGEYCSTLSPLYCIED